MSVGIPSRNPFEMMLKKTKKKKLDDVIILWSLEEENRAGAAAARGEFLSINSSIQEWNRVGYTFHVHLHTVLLTRSAFSITNPISTWKTSEAQTTFSPLEKTSLHDKRTHHLRSQIQQHIAFTPPTQMNNTDSSSKHVVIMRGLPGSGKSTITRLVQAMAHEQQRSVYVCSADHFFETPTGYYHDKSKLTEAHEAAQLAFRTALEQGVQIVLVDNTHSQRWEYDVYLNGTMHKAHVAFRSDITQC
jgi:hypothetical protein